MKPIQVILSFLLCIFFLLSNCIFADSAKEAFKEAIKNLPAGTYSGESRRSDGKIIPCEVSIDYLETKSEDFFGAKICSKAEDRTACLDLFPVSYIWFFSPKQERTVGLKDNLQAKQFWELSFMTTNFLKIVDGKGIQIDTSLNVTWDSSENLSQINLWNRSAFSESNNTYQGADSKNSSIYCWNLKSK